MVLAEGGGGGGGLGLLVVIVFLGVAVLLYLAMSGSMKRMRAHVARGDFGDGTEAESDVPTPRTDGDPGGATRL